MCCLVAFCHVLSTPNSAGTLPKPQHTQLSSPGGRWGNRRKGEAGTVVGSTCWVLRGMGLEKRRDKCSDMREAVRIGKSPLDQDRDQWERLTGKVRVPKGTACSIIVTGI